METDRILDDFARSERLPAGAIRACLASPDDVAPAFLDILRRCAGGAALSGEEEDALFLIVHVLAEIGDSRAFQPLMDFLEGDQERVERILGEAVTEHLQQILIATCDGDFDRLYRVINNPGLDEFVRSAAFGAWTYFAVIGRIDRAEARRYLHDCFDTLRPVRGSYVWVSWVDAVAYLGFADMREQVKQAFDEERLSWRALVFSDFEDMLGHALEADGGDEWLRAEGLHPFGETIGALSRWHGYSEEYIRRKKQAETEQLPYGDVLAARLPGTVTNPFRHVGRNDPCPCGSGRKFKKCCLN